MPDHTCIHQLIATAPRPRSEPRLFGEWLKQVSNEVGMSITQLMAGHRADEEYVIADRPSMVTKGQRRQIYEKVLLRLVQLTTADSPRSRAVLPTEISVFFTGLVGAHRGRCQALIVDAIRGATQRIRMMSYCFASKEIAEALVVAARRIPVELVADRTSVPRQLEDTGVRIHVDRLHHRAHNKVLIVDDCMVFTGSFNFTSTADHQNAENLVRIKNRTVIGQYVSYWQRTIAELEKSSATGYPPARRGVESRRNAVTIGRLKGAPHV